MKFKLKENAVEMAAEKMKEVEDFPLLKFEEMSDKCLIIFLGVILRLSKKVEFSDEQVDEVLNGIEERAMRYVRQMMINEELASWEE